MLTRNGYEPGDGKSQTVISVATNPTMTNKQPAPATIHHLWRSLNRIIIYRIITTQDTYLRLAKTVSLKKTEGRLEISELSASISFPPLDIVPSAATAIWSSRPDDAAFAGVIGLDRSLTHSKRWNYKEDVTLK